MRLALPGLRARPFAAVRAGLALMLSAAILAGGCNWQRDEVVEHAKPKSEVAQASSSEDKPSTDKLPTSPVAEESVWHTDLVAALAEARQRNRPLLVVSIIGDLTRRC